MADASWHIEDCLPRESSDNDFFTTFGTSQELNLIVSMVSLFRTIAANAGSKIVDDFRFDFTNSTTLSVSHFGQATDSK